MPSSKHPVTGKIEELLDRSKDSLVTWLYLVFPHMTYSGDHQCEPAAVHHLMSDYMLASVGNRYGLDRLYEAGLINRSVKKFDFANMMARSMAKSVYACLAFPTWLLFFSSKKYIVLYGHGADGATHGHFVGLQKELVENPVLRALGVRPIPGGEWNNTTCKLSVPAPVSPSAPKGIKEVTIEYKSFYTSSRGKRAGAARVDTVIFDDIDQTSEGTRKGIDNPDIQDYQIRKIYGEINQMCFNPDDFTKIWVGTPIHEKQPFYVLVKQHLDISKEENPLWASLECPAILNYGEDNMRSAWEERISVETFERKLQEAKDVSESAYNTTRREYLLDLIPPDSQIFKSSMFEEYTQEGNYLSALLTTGDEYSGVKQCATREMHIYIGLDPAYSKKNRADESVYTVYGVHPPTGRRYVLDMIAGKWDPYESEQQFIRLVKLWNPHVAGVEDEQGKKQLIQNFEKALLRHGLYTKIEPISAPTTMAKHIKLEIGLYSVLSRGAVAIPSGSVKWKPHLLKQIESVTREGIKAAHDDYVDSLYIAEQVVRMTYGEYRSEDGIPEAEKKKRAKINNETYYDDIQSLLGCDTSEDFSILY